LPNNFVNFVLNNWTCASNFFRRNLLECFKSVAIVNGEQGAGSSEERSQDSGVIDSPLPLYFLCFLCPLCSSASSVPSALF
jgi:hypothetical protein